MNQIEGLFNYNLCLIQPVLFKINTFSPTANNRYIVPPFFIIFVNGAFRFLRKMEKTITFVNEVISELEEKMRQEPYQINLLEEVHLHDDEEKGRGKKNVGENAHTRILRKILMFRTQSDYPLLRDLIQYVRKESDSISWDAILSHISVPVFHPEKNCNWTSGRIDLLIEESGKYAIIFENKINGATDQTNQLGRYIEHLRKSGYQEDQIFVLYLSAEGESPEDNSWILGNDDYRERFSLRYFNLSYKYSVLPWMENILNLKTTGQKILKGQGVLKEAIGQYVDYLRGKFSLRLEENEKLDEVLREKLVKNSLPLNEQMKVLDVKLNQLKDRLKTLRKKIDSEQETAYNNEMLRKVNLIYERIREIKTSLLKSHLSIKEFHETYSRSKIYDRECYTGVEFKMNNQKYILYIGAFKGGKTEKFFCSIISYPRKGMAIDEQTLHRLRHYFRRVNNDWMAEYYPLGDYETAIKKMNEVLKSLP